MRSRTALPLHTQGPAAKTAAEFENCYEGDEKETPAMGCNPTMGRGAMLGTA